MGQMRTDNGVPILENEADDVDYKGDMQWLAIVLRASLRAAWKKRDAALERERTAPPEETQELERLRALLNTPEVEQFDKAVPLEAAHQVLRWGTDHDDGKAPEDWFWLVGYLAGKALAASKAGDTDKAKHHCISTAAALRNWHAHIRSGSSVMRPGIESPEARGAVEEQRPQEPLEST